VALVVNNWGTGQSSQSFSWSSGVEIGVVNVKLGHSFFKENKPPGSVLGNSVVEPLVLGLVSRSIMNKWNSIINMNGNSFTSDVEEHIESTIVIVLHNTVED